MIQKGLNILYPPVCPFCGHISPEGICVRCREKIIYVKEPFCVHCGKPLDDETQEYCRDCGRRIAASARGSCIAQGRGLWIHREPVSGAVYRFKYKNKRNWGRIFANEMEKYYGSQIRRGRLSRLFQYPSMPQGGDREALTSRNNRAGTEFSYRDSLQDRCALPS